MRVYELFLQQFHPVTHSFPLEYPISPLCPESSPGVEVILQSKNLVRELGESK